MTPFPFRRRGAWALGLALFFFYMLGTSRERPWADGTPIWQVAEAIVTRGEVSIATRWPPTLPLGKDGKAYAAAPLLQSLVQVPAAAITHWLGQRSPEAGSFALRLTSHLAPSALAALTCVLFFGICRRERLSRRAALLGTALLATGTFVAVYARYPYSEILQAACFTGAFAYLLAVREAPTWRHALSLGIWTGLLIASKLIYVVALPGALLWIAVTLRARRRELLSVIGWAVLGALPSAALVLGYNQARWGSPFITGYNPTVALSQENVLVGLWGLLLSPGKSLFLFSPVLILSVVALPRLWRRYRHLGWALVATVLPVVLTNATLLFWSGDYAWGPRYLVFAAAALLVPGCLLMDDLVRAAPSLSRRVSAGAVAAVAVSGLFVQVLGCAFFWDHFIRIQREARNHWLGTPNTAGTPFPDFGGVCGACFEDMHGLQWLPPFSAIEGHWWLMRHVPFGHDWMRAEQDGPWHRYTSLRLAIPGYYERARVDWWFLDYRGTHRRAGVLLLLGMTLGLAGSAVVVARELRRSSAAKLG